MPPRNHHSSPIDRAPLAVDIATALIDAQLLDVLAQIESLLRHGREMQQELLRLRQPAASSRRKRRGNQGLERIVRQMTGDTQDLSRVLRTLHGTIRREHGSLDSRRQRP